LDNHNLQQMERSLEAYLEEHQLHRAVVDFSEEELPPKLQPLVVSLELARARVLDRVQVLPRVACLQLSLLARQLLQLHLDKPRPLLQVFSESQLLEHPPLPHLACRPLLLLLPLGRQLLLLPVRLENQQPEHLLLQPLVKRLLPLQVFLESLQLEHRLHKRLLPLQVLSDLESLRLAHRLKPQLHQEVFLVPVVHPNQLMVAFSAPLLSPQHQVAECLALLKSLLLHRLKLHLLNPRQHLRQHPQCSTLVPNRLHLCLAEKLNKHSQVDLAVHSLAAKRQLPLETLKAHS